MTDLENHEGYFNAHEDGSISLTNVGIIPTYYKSLAVSALSLRSISIAEANELIAAAYNDDTELLVLRDVTKENFTALKHSRARARQHHRFTYLKGQEILAIRFTPSFLELGVTHSTMGSFIGLAMSHKFHYQYSHKLTPLGMSTWMLADGVVAEAEACFRPHGRGCASLPTVIFEVGTASAESLTRLRIDAALWLTYHADDLNVKCVLLFAVDKKSTKMVIEKWCIGGTGVPIRKQEVLIERLRARDWEPILGENAAMHTPMIMEPGTVELNPGSCVTHRLDTTWSYRVKGAPLILGFEDMFDVRWEQVTKGDMFFGDELLAGLGKKVFASA